MEVSNARFESKVKLMKMEWIQKLFDGSEQAWKQMLQVTAGVNEIMLPFFSI